MTPTPAADEPEYLKVEEVAARLKLKEKTIRDWIGRGGRHRGRRDAEPLLERLDALAPRDSARRSVPGEP